MKILFLLFLSFNAFSYVENANHGYVNCMACHVAPNGGGVLNEYGRSLSQELMSTWKVKGAEHPLFGAIKNTEKLLVGGDYRRIQTHIENDKIKAGKEFTMEANLEVAFRATPKLTIVGAVGKQGGPEEIPTKGDIISERHFVMYGDFSKRFRIGKFRHHVGLNDPAHTRLTKALFGFGSNSETYNFEYSQFFETGELFLTSDFGKIDKKVEEVGEKSFSLNYAHYFLEKTKVGGTFFFGEKLNERRNLYNIYAQISLPKHFYIKTENVYQTKYAPTVKEEKTKSFATQVSIGNQSIKGITPYLVAELGQSDLANSKLRQNVYGLGVNFLPLTHFEFNIEVQRRKSRSPKDSYTDYGYMIFHFYL